MPMDLPRTFPMRVAGGKIIQVPSVGFGTWAADDPTWCSQAVADALKAGYRHLDCAWEYGVDSEVGKGIRMSGVPRKEIFVTTKFWPHFAAPENVQVCLEQVLERMGLDYVDLFLAHFPGALKPQGDLSQAVNFLGATPDDQKAATDADGNYIPDILHCPKSVAKLNGADGSFVPTWQAMKKLVKSGKCRAIGVSNFEQEHIEEILPYATHNNVPISCNQIEAHPWYPNTKLISFLHRESIVPSIYSPFAPKRFRLERGQVLGEPFQPNGVLLLQEGKVREVAHRNNMDVGQVLQSWAVQRHTIPLAKSQSKHRISSNLFVQRLPENDMQKLDSLSLEGNYGKCIDLNLLFPGLKFHD
ncbi:aldo/keto reductase family protein [Aspergillus puulaauensis]|uniref:D-xylose reductase [NAD(P)H] n=1 Tax=Aspergillus puulaauensis TaxID=1220207 RepID=A0A7R7XIC7_9EURO|nr:uncharacterized protein APUU_30095A [Aspergillus puulaauensis]BCS21870.1 hypothetical protein APUU_30095A [Aspergillus puulaauensis]